MYHFSKHALSRIAEMGLTTDDVLAVLMDPETIMPNTPGHPRGHRFVGRGIVVAVADDGTIMTVLWDGAEGRDDDGQPRYGEDA